jgi:hypothetical protein
MADIVKFRCIDGGAADTSALQSDEPALLFTTTSEGQLDLQVGQLSMRPSRVSRSTIRDWENQELADLFRVKRLLDAAGVVCEVDRGVTDEGDPWFVFCQSDGDIFAHLCRIDGAYILDSPSIERPLRGRDFNELINDFTGLNKTASGSSLDDNNDDTHRVVRLSRSSTLRLHPSAILAALIWTFLLSSDELVLVRPDDDGAGTPDGLEGLFGAESAAAGDLPDDQQDETRLWQSEKSVATKAIEQAGALQAGDKTGPSAQQLAASAVPSNTALALSTLAINMGLLSEALLMEKNSELLVELEAAADQGSMFHNETETASELQTTAVHVVPSNTGPQEDVDWTAKADLSVLKTMRDAKTYYDHVVPSLDGSVKLSLLQHKEALFSDAQTNDQASIKALKVRENIALEQVEIRDQQAPDLNPDMSVFADVFSSAQTFGEISKIVETVWQPVLSEYTFQDITVQASVELSSIMTLGIDVPNIATSGANDIERLDGVSVDSTSSSFLPNDIAPNVSPATDAGTSYGDKARYFIDHVLSTSTVDIVYLDDHLILIDTDVLLNPMEQRFSQTWDFSDGGSISLIGLQADFANHALFA